MKNIETLTTERFLLKNLKPELVTESYLRWFECPENIPHITNTNYKKLDDLKTFVLEKYAASNVIMWGVFTKDTLEHIANIKYEPINFTKKFAVMGILIGASQWRGKKLAFEVISETAKYLKYKYSTSHIVLGVHEDNTNAISAYTKIGFKKSTAQYIQVNSEGIEMVLEI